MALTTFAVLLSLCTIGYSYKLLVVFPIPGKSHSILGEGYLRLLIEAGHEVTYLTAIPVKISSPRLRHVLVESNSKYFEDESVFDFVKLMNKEIDFSDHQTVLDLMYKVANATVLHPNVQNLILDVNEKYDAVIAEWMFNELYSGFSEVFGCPFIWSSSLNPHPMVLSLLDEIPNPAYTADILQSASVTPFTFMERVQQLWILVHNKYLLWKFSSRDEFAYKMAFEPAMAKRGKILPPYDVVKYNISLMLSNAHISTGEATKLPINNINIGGYHINRTIPRLPENLQMIMDNSKHGVIYFSMGSLLKSHGLPEPIKKGILKIFSEMKYTIIWKFEDQLLDLPKNVHIVPWAPQQSILAHPNCILFITHGGLLSTTEAIHFGVPIIGIPMFADQELNVKRAKAKGFCKKVSMNYNTPNELKAAINEILTNPSYRKRAKELSFIYHDRPVSPGAELVHWVEHVVKTRGALHLRSPALHVPLYQKFYLDLLAVLLVILTVIVSTLYFTLMQKTTDIKNKKYD